MSRTVAVLECVLLLAAAPWWQWKSMAQENAIKPNCNSDGTGTVCSCGSTAHDSGIFEPANLSQSTNTLTVTCEETFSFVPSESKSVCVGTPGQPSLAACQPKQRGTEVVIAPLVNFLSSPPTPPVDVEWKNAGKNSHSIVFPKANFPFTDKAFFVGCQNSNQKHCVVPVRVKARKSVLEDKVLKCAYGTDSNTPVPEVTLDPTSKSLTVDCGEDGTMPLTGELPTVYYCKDSATDACDPVKDVTEILPGFAKEWWTPVNGLKTAAKLTVPEGGFPVEPKTVVLGCNPKRAKAKVDAEPESHAEGGLPTCRVKVTFDAPSSSSSGMRLSLNTLAFLSALFSLASLV
ncbi:SAG-related sequence [Besnoitia besnoiti]|uniref:SAG-related sequence n=1 Tax=Besnoitia besnoiti TaxID=94643 RepID=A0A2A9MIP5_BESBE|nr:SAG-related sequence [Besnoitia besnoiti]PFH35262.1 SAG-related sequence [Besnoitia besnoiti]